MRTSIRREATPVNSSTVALTLGMCAAAMAGIAAAPDAHAAIVTFSTPIVIPANTSGVYINLLTGATGSSGTTLPGWDFNPYLSNGGTQLGFYWNPNTGTRNAGVAATATTGPYLDLAPGSTISSASVFSSAINGTSGSPFLTTGTHNLGFMFLNEATNVFDYGYLTMTNTASNGFPATITGWSFDNTGAAFTIPVPAAPGTPVPEPSVALLLSASALAMGAVNLRGRRRRAKAAAH